ncbi:glycerate dehydrogenase [Cnuella takakiae]|uniref:Glycerate dehydrogenase n=1 Tax=Cnuella takakiae TaxID=1302690 RepID=A0A1M5DZF2_9BACT|nr:D-2-hydroxyacid dehydrogenase [Cnuella takakiae]OLY93824.1 glycerate dehydrogenase [Cnuella takakiae]SHF72349.1 glycerate dehydrogenase [Cnuella takakiae]
MNTDTKPTIVVADGYTLNPSDLDWAPLEALGTLTVYDRTPSGKVVERCKDAQLILTNKVVLDTIILEQLPQLKYIGVLATGYNVIDTAAAKALGITVCNVPGYGTASVAQHTIALLLELTNAVGKHHASVQAGKWQTSADWCYTQQPIMELAGKTMGIVGMGSIGKQVAQIAAALGMQVIYYNPSEKKNAAGTQTSLAELFRHSDVVSLHCPLTPSNTGFVNKVLLQQMKPTAFLLNTARGQLINEADLAAALKAGVLAGAALDVLSAEPPRDGNPLLDAPNCIITPHNAWVSREARSRVMEITTANVQAFLEGKPQNRVA